MSVLDEFATVELILNSAAETRAVDAFALSLIKAERQMRKLVTFLVYQYPAFSDSDIAPLRNTLASNRKVYFDGFVAGFDGIYPRSVQTLIGEAAYPQLRRRIDEAIDHRNKIFHGQLTAKSLERKDLVNLVEDVKAWCIKLGKAAMAEFEFDGLMRPSFRKSPTSNLSSQFKVQLASVSDYANFLKTTMERK